MSPSTSRTSNTYYNGCKGSKYVPSSNDTHLVAHSDLTSNKWLSFGCIQCIKDRESYEILEMPINVTIHRNGLGTHILGKCHIGHTFSMGKQFETPTRRYKRKITDSPENKPKRQRCVSNDYNVLFALATLLSGIGQTELTRISSTINLPVNSVNIYNTISKYYLNWIILEEGLKTVKDALEDEVQQTLAQRNIDISKSDVNKVVSGEARLKEITRLKDIEVGITVSTDMGWQKRSSGNRYDSPSGHMFFIGAITKKVVHYKLFSKKCNICQWAKKKNQQPRPHPCPKNFDGSSKSMEAIAAHNLIESLYLLSRGSVYCKEIVADDDSSMKSHCSHAHGLDRSIPEPKWLADPNHRCKVVAKPFYKLALAPKKTSLVTKHDAKRIKFYYSYFIRVNRCKEGMTASWMSKHVWCVLYHLFDVHHLCTSDYCWKKRKEEEKNNNVQTRTNAAVDDSEAVMCIKILDTQNIDIENDSEDEYDTDDDRIKVSETNEEIINPKQDGHKYYSESDSEIDREDESDQDCMSENNDQYENEPDSKDKLEIDSDCDQDGHKDYCENESDDDTEDEDKYDSDNNKNELQYDSDSEIDSDLDTEDEEECDSDSKSVFNEQYCDEREDDQDEDHFCDYHVTKDIINLDKNDNHASQDIVDSDTDADSVNDVCSSQESESHPLTSKKGIHSLRHKKGYYRDMKKDKVTFDQMKEKFRQYTTEKVMIEILHPYDTQTNEGMNTGFNKRY